MIPGSRDLCLKSSLLSIISTNNRNIKRQRTHHSSLFTPRKFTCAKIELIMFDCSLESISLILCVKLGRWYSSSVLWLVAIEWYTYIEEKFFEVWSDEAVYSFKAKSKIVPEKAMRSSNTMKGPGLHLRYLKIPIYVPKCTSFTTMPTQEVVVGNKLPLNQHQSTSKDPENVLHAQLPHSKSFSCCNLRSRWRIQPNT